jgi:hypothetical protein
MRDTSSPWRTLRAFAWMRWRVLMNSLERTGARDTLERFSLAIEQIGPMIAFGLFAPSAVALAAIAGYSGYWLPSSDRVLTFDGLRVLLLAASGLSIVGPIMMPSLEQTSAVRLLLLPIPRRTLYVAQAATALSDPWILLAVPIVLALPLGAALAGAFGVAAAALVAGVLFLALLVGLSALSTLVLHLVVRDRRRGEWLALLLVMLPMLFVLPGLMDASRSREQRLADRNAAAERRERGEESFPELAVRIGRRAYGMIPSELFAAAARAPARGRASDVLMPILGLAAGSLALHGLGLLAFGRLLDSPAAVGRRQAAGASDWRVRRLPGLSRASAAVALAHFRLAARTPRGRSILFVPFIVFAMFALLMSRRGVVDSELASFAGGLPLAAFGSFVAVLSLLPFAVNQFAIDRAGLTLSMLAPMTTREFLAGKAVGSALIAAGPSLLCIPVSFALFRDGPIALWLSLPFALVATYALMAPAAAALSAIFPRHVDLNSIGRGSNAHGIAGLLGLVSFVAALLPCVAIAAVSAGVFRRPTLTLISMAVWCGIALVVSRLLFVPVAMLVDRRRENVVMVAS